MNKPNDYEVRFNQDQVKNYVQSVNWEKRLKKEIPFFLDLFKKNNFTTIADLGCGPGKHAIALAEEDLDITGIDIDEEMIKFANNLPKSNKASDIKFIVENVFENPSHLENKFDFLFTLGNALMIIWSSKIESDNEDQVLLSIFKSLANMLKSGGGLFFQILNSDNPRDGHIVSKISKSDDDKNQMLVKHFIPIVSESKLYTTFSTLEWDEDNTPQVISTRNGHLFLVPFEKLKSVIVEAGFSKLKFFENYNGKEFDQKTSDSLMCFAIKS